MYAGGVLLIRILRKKNLEVVNVAYPAKCMCIINGNNGKKSRSY